MTRPGHLRNRRIIVERSFMRTRSQRFRSWWTNPYGSMSHDGYHATFVGAVLGAIGRKCRAELQYWQTSRPDKTWGSS